MDDKAIEKIAERVQHVDLRDHILSWDRKQGGELNDSQRLCPTHGNRLTIRGDGNVLICGVTRPTECQYSEPVSR